MKLFLRSRDAGLLFVVISFLIIKRTREASSDWRVVKLRGHLGLVFLG